MNKFISTLFSWKKITLALGLLTVLPAQADTLLHLRCGWYIAGAGDITWHNNIKFQPPGGGFTKFRYDTGFGTSASFGVLLRHWRLEVQGLYQKNDLKRLTIQTPRGLRHSARTSGNVRQSAIMFNGYWDYLIPNSWWVFYVGAGIGPAFHHREAVDFSGFFAQKNQTTIGWQAMAGFSYEIVDHTFLTLGWRIFSTPKVRSPTERSKEIVILNNLELGVRIELF